MEMLNLSELSSCIDGFPQIPCNGEGYKKFSLTRTQFTAACRKLCLIEFGYSPDQTIKCFKKIDQEMSDDYDMVIDLYFGVGVEENEEHAQTGYFWAFSEDGVSRANRTILCHAVKWQDGEVVAESFQVQLPPRKIHGRTDRFLSSIQEGGNDDN